MILVVDDHGDTREALVRLLKLEGYLGIGVTCGGEALLFLQTHVPTLVLLDFNMPDMDGLSVLAEIRRSPRLAEVPVIMFSASSGDLRERAMAAGASAYVVKASLDWAGLRSQVIRWAGAATPAETVTIDTGQMPQLKVQS